MNSKLNYNRYLEERYYEYQEMMETDSDLLPSMESLELFINELKNLSKLGLKKEIEVIDLNDLNLISLAA